MTRLAIALIALNFFATESFGQDLKLEDLLFQPEELPGRCRLKPFEEGKAPCDITANAFISADRGFLDCFAAKLITEPSLIPNVTKGLFSIYEDQAEIGVFGLEMDTEENARTIYSGMQGSNPDEKSIKFIQSGKILIFLWKDGGENSSFNELKRMIDERIG